MSTIKNYVERCVSAHGRDCDMLDMITVIIGVVGALLGIAGSLLVVGGTLLLVALIKKLPAGFRAVVSATAASVVAMTLLKHCAAEYMDVLLFKSVISASVVFGICGFYLILGSVVLGNWVKMLFASAGVPTVQLLHADVPDRLSDNSKKNSSPSFVLKVSSVMLQ